MSARKINSYVLFSCIVAALGGLLFGLDQGLMNGALDPIRHSFGLNTKQAASFASIMLYGAVVGALVSGVVSFRLGRKLTLIMTALFFVVFAFLSTTTTVFSHLMVFRFLLGLAVGIASFIVPLYLSEIAPTPQRGGFIAVYQLMITIGILLVFITNHYILAAGFPWQKLFYPIIIPASIMFVCLWFVPQSPRWLCLRGKDKAANKVLNQIRDDKTVIAQELAEVSSVAHQKSGVFSLLFHGFYLKILLLGVAIQMLQQLTGINAVIYYSTTIFSNAGFSNPSIATIIIGVVNMLSTFIAIFFVDVIGRKKIMYIGLSLMLVFLLTSGIIFHVDAMLNQGEVLATWLQRLLVISTVLFIMSFSMSAGPVAWILCAEIFPLKGRDLGLTVTTAVNWIFAALVVGYSLPFMAHQDGSPNLMGGSYLFLFFAFCCFMGILLMYFFTPETKGVSLESMEEKLKAGVKMKHIGLTND